MTWSEINGDVGGGGGNGRPSSIGGSDGISSPYYLDLIAIGAYGAVAKEQLRTSRVDVRKRSQPSPPAITELQHIAITTVFSPITDFWFSIRDGGSGGGVAGDEGGSGGGSVGGGCEDKEEEEDDNITLNYIFGYLCAK
ncbi:hypothetical protein QVD17_03457 [Tagetes erecta]|uniref:Uncharacterized protein n=1 Tax=Tagetes erecta TaxID=13708 RepID=A0AAD8LED0_TARER|nr:hypothetical protein QVD17_03457 [Tagetes erecta]